MDKVKKTTIIRLIVCATIIVLSPIYFIRGDFTANQTYSLSKASFFVMEQLKEPVTVTLYASAQLPHNYKKLSEEFIAMLREYKAISQVPFQIQVVKIYNEEQRSIALSAGISPTLIVNQLGELERMQEIFLGAIFKIGDQKEILPEITQNTPFEYEITRFLKKQTLASKGKAGFVTGHREIPIYTNAPLVNELANLTTIDTTSLLDRDRLTEFDVLCIVGPKDRFNNVEIENLKYYLEQGGDLFIALNHAVGQLGNGRKSGYINPTGIETLLEEYGMKINYDFIIDNNCASIPLRENQQQLNLQASLSFPYIPVITNFSDHTITHGLNSIVLTYASSIEQIKTKSTYIFRPLAASSQISGTEESPVFFNLKRQWSVVDFNNPNQYVAAKLKNEGNGSTIITITDADFITLSNDCYTSPRGNDNLKFAVNSIEWLADNTGLIQLRNKYTTIPLIEATEASQRNWIRVINFMFPIIVLLGIVMVKLRKKNKQREYRAQPGYID